MYVFPQCASHFIELAEIDANLAGLSRKGSTHRWTVRRALFAVIACFIVGYLIWLILSGMFIFPLCANCSIEALWAVLWVAAILSTGFLGRYLYKEVLEPDGLRDLARAKRCGLRVVYGLALILAAIWIVLLIMYLVFFSQVGTAMNGTTSVSGIKGTIKIGLSDSEILTVRAEDELDAFYGLGWGHATYRLFQMEIQRRVGQGILSEVVGDAGLDVDKFTRTTGFYQSALANLADLDPEIEKILQAYVNGVNDFIRGNYRHSVGFKVLGFQAKPNFSIADMLTYGKLISYSLSANWNNEIQRISNHMVRNVSAARLEQMDPMDPQTTTTVISDAALGDRYENITASTHRSVSLASEIERLDTFMATAGAAASADAIKDAVNVMRRNSAKKHTSRSSTTYHNTADFKLDGESGTSDVDDETYLSDLLRMASTRSPKTKANTVYERAKAAMPTFFNRMPGHRKASNNWVLSRNRTGTGSPLLCNDPHLDLSLPSIWMIVGLNTTKFNVIGASFPGLPGIMIGHNYHSSWGVTNSGMDVQDLYVMDEVNATAYRHNGVVKSYTFRDEKIKVKGGDTVDWPVRESVYGPVVNPLYDEVKLTHSMSLRWTSLDRNDTTLQAFYNIMLAQNFTSFRSALQYYVAPAQNFIYADTTGDIGYQLPGRMPIRVENHTGTYPVPGDGSFDWVRMSGYWNESLYVENPPEGYIASANNMIATSKYPLLILNDRDWEPRYRAERIVEMIISPYKLTIDDMQSMQLDVKSLYASELISTFRSIKGLGNSGSKWLSDLKAWDGVETSDSKEALVFEAISSELTLLAIPENGEPFLNPRYWLAMSLNSTYPDPICKGDKYDCRATIGKAINTALKRHVIGSTSKKTWGAQHHTVLRHIIFDNTTVACLFDRDHASGGSHFTVNAAFYDAYNFDTIQGPSYRQIIDLSDFSNSLYVLPGGPSEVVTSKYYVDMFKAWNDGVYVPLTTNGPDSLASFTIKKK